MSWDKEKEDRYNLAIKTREEKIKAIEVQREQSKAERENMRSAIASKKE